MDLLKLKKTLLPVSLALLVLLITYFGNQWYAERFNIIGKDYSYIFYNFNKQVPFLSWTIYPYIIAYPFWLSAFVYIGYRSEKNLHILTTIAFITLTICGIWYFFWQSDVEGWRVTSGLFIDGNYLMPRQDLNFTESIVMWIYKSAGPRNALPSMHTIVSWIMILGVRLDKKMPKLAKLIIWVLALMIIISTQTLKQHYIIDTIVGIILAEGFFWIVVKLNWDKYVSRFLSKLNIKLKLVKEEDSI